MSPSGSWSAELPGTRRSAATWAFLVTTGEIVDVVIALIRVYIAHGNRGSRKAARLKHLLETWTLEQYLAATEELLGKQLFRSPVTATREVERSKTIPHSHIGAFPQKQDGLYYLGVAVPVGQVTPEQLVSITEIAEQYGSGEIRPDRLAEFYHTQYSRSGARNRQGGDPARGF